MIRDRSTAGPNALDLLRRFRCYTDFMPQLDLEKKRKSQRDWYERNKETEKTRTAQRRNATRAENHERIDDIKESVPCADCGKHFPAVCMDFDHLDASTKVRAVSLMTGLLWAKIEAEIAKCEVVCACCHRIRTRDRLRCSLGEMADPPGSEPGDILVRVQGEQL